MQLLDINVKKSKIYFYSLWGMSLVSGICIFITTLSVTLKLMLTGVLIIYSIYLFWQRDTILRLQLRQDNVWKIFSKSRQYTGVLRGESLITHYLCILRFNIENQKQPQTHVIFPDAIQKDQFRQLIVKIRTSVAK